MSAQSEQRVVVKSSVSRAGRVNAQSRRIPAPFSLRCGALLIDYTILVGVIAFATLVAQLFKGSARWAGLTAITLGYLAAVIVGALNLIVLAGLSGRTFGKWVTGLRIEQRDGEPLSFWRAGLRHLVGYTISFLTLGLGFLIAAFNDHGLALHDRIAGTIVVRDWRGSRARMS